jgi:hypothetical protein
MAAAVASPARRGRVGLTGSVLVGLLLLLALVGHCAAVVYVTKAGSSFANCEASGYCRITSLTACQSAAVALSLADITATTQNSASLVRGCRFQGGSLFFNSHPTSTTVANTAAILLCTIDLVRSYARALT